VTTLTLADLLPSEWGEPSFELFEACASYSAPMDCIIYLREDEPARADRIDQFLTILWHPHEDRVIGIKLKGIRFLFEILQSAVKSVTGKDIPNDRFVPLIGAVQIALKMQAGPGLMESFQNDRVKRLAALTKSYEIARGIVDGVTFDAGQFVAAQGGSP